MNYNRPAPTAVQPIPYNAQQMGAIVSRSTEGYVLSDPANASIPKEIRDQFPTDDQGRLLFFTHPPLNTQHLVTGSAQSEKSRPLQHSDRYLKALAVRKRKFDEQDTKTTSIDVADDAATQLKQTDGDETAVDSDYSQPTRSSSVEIRKRVTNLVTESMKQSTYKEYQTQYGDEWRKFLLADLDYQALCRRRESEMEQQAAKMRMKFAQSHLGRLNGQYNVNSQGYITGWQKNFFTSSYLDDYDSRLP